MSPDLERVAVVAAQECIRQKVGLRELANLIEAYRYMMERTEINASVLHFIAKTVEPCNHDGYRKIPVTFENGGYANSPNTIETGMDSLLQFVNGLKGNPTHINKWIKDYLQVHPWKDGNGRTAWILYNWLMNQMDGPDNLPEFDFV